MVTITRGVQRIKHDLAELVSPAAIHEIGRRLDLVWRDRLLDPVTTIHLFLLTPRAVRASESWVPSPESSRNRGIAA